MALLPKFYGGFPHCLTQGTKIYNDGDKFWRCLSWLHCYRFAASPPREEQMCLWTDLGDPMLCIDYEVNGYIWNKILLMLIVIV